MRILLTSDNHLGYKEHDPIRHSDSFNTFEEILQHSIDCDLLIQGGDLFHENAPSRNTLLRTNQLLIKYILGNKKINWSSNTLLNINNPNINIKLPILSIHGNHDDPSGIHSNSSLELLSSTGLINYIGKSKSIDFLDITPVLIHGNKKIAIYGIGNIKDRRIYRIFKENKINYNRPENYAEYVNILVLHQNRVRRSECDYLPVEFIDPFFDIVIYGHEHEPFMCDTENFLIIQCGSTIRTSLSEMEKGDKYCYKIDIGDEINIERIKLNTVRPFIFKTLKYESEKVLKEMISGFIIGIDMPLVRVRIENGEVFSRNRFVLDFKDKVANFNDMISFVKRKKAINFDDENIKKVENKIDIVESFLGKLETKVLPESLFGEAINKFTNGDKNAFGKMISDVKDLFVERIRRDTISDDLLENEMERIKEEINRENGYIKRK